MTCAHRFAFRTAQRAPAVSCAGGQSGDSDAGFSSRADWIGNVTVLGHDPMVSLGPKLQKFSDFGLQIFRPGKFGPIVTCQKGVSRLRSDI